MTRQPKKQTREQKAKQRAEELKQIEIARHLGVTEAAVSKRIRQHAKGGPQALQPYKANGRPPKLDETAKQTLVKKLEGGAVAAGFPMEHWTQARVKQVIEREFGVVYHQNYISRLLDNLGWNEQKPDSIVIERDEDLIRSWLSRDWPRIEKGAAVRRRDLF